MPWQHLRNRLEQLLQRQVPSRITRHLPQLIEKVANGIHFPLQIA
jgi:hypothetical protein